MPLIPLDKDLGLLRKIQLGGLALFKLAWIQLGVADFYPQTLWVLRGAVCVCDGVRGPGCIFSVYLSQRFSDICRCQILMIFQTVFLSSPYHSEWLNFKLKGNATV